MLGITGSLILLPAWLRARSQKSCLSSDNNMAMRFLVIGDWGTGGRQQRRVAKGMSAAAENNELTAIVSTGDNIYPSGVDSAYDAQWKSKFENIYNLPGLNVPWIAVLGNHDHRKNPDAQIEYGTVNSNWIMPSRFFAKSYANTKRGTTTKVAFFCLDTQPIMADPSGAKVQLDWLDRAMRETEATWKVVVGHHPIRSYGHYKDQSALIKYLKPILDERDADLYLCGHDHDLQVIEHPSDSFTCVVSGSGGGKRPTSRGNHSLFAQSIPGFVSLEAAEREMRICVCDEFGSSLFHHSIRK